MTIRRCVLVAAAWMLAAAVVGAAPAPDSRRLSRAKDFIADEQWQKAIVELKAAAVDPREANKDEALYWLAHSEHQAGEQAAAIEAIARLERGFPASRWVHQARALLIEIAQQLRRDDVLWRMATPPPPPAVPRAAFPAPTPAAAPPSTPAPPAAPAPPASTPPRPAGAFSPFPAPPAMPVPPVPPDWFTMPFPPDVDLRVQALSGLMQSHADRVIPLLKDIALDPNNPGDGRRAVLILAQSSRPEARTCVLEVARLATEPVRIAAIREAGRFEGPNVTTELLQVYSTSANARIKREVVTSLGDRADTGALLRIARMESDPTVRNTAIVTLGRAGAREQLRTLYARGPRDARVSVITALFNAKDEEELIRIADRDSDPTLRQQARRQLQLLGTPRALQYLAEHKQ
jgi:hypothetical protein